MLKEKNTKTSKLGLLSLLCFVATFIIVGCLGNLLPSDSGISLMIVLGLMLLSVVLAIAGLVGKKQNQKNNVFSIVTIVMTVVIFVLGML
jgi:NADH:ubiquinone oxidoreductase subunit K